MKAARLALLALACALPLAAAAQWQWIDKDGRKVFSDQAPPPDVAPNKILKRPGERVAAPAPTAQAAAPASAAKLPVAKPSGKDPALEKKRLEAEEAEAKKRKADEEKLAADRAENCTRARTAKATIDSGQRMARINAKGEREFMDDKERSEEARRLDAVMARDCGARDRQ
ncbi:MAG TPA: DUF4124 domain-containing protein [Ramlibacter sp.]|jgi:hypothetical protein|nr:DUF4124 domain-containing protein [Ramlibacter sp.]